MDGALLLILLLGVMYVVVILPRQRQVQRHRQLISSLAVGDEIVTIGGLHGIVLEIEDDSVTLELAPGVQVRLAKDAVAARPEAPADNAAEEDAGD